MTNTPSNCAAWACRVWPRFRHNDALLTGGSSLLLTALLAGFGRAIAEVGAVIMVGGNINHVTRVMTTTIALETSKGNLALALALGAILIGIAVSVTGLVSLLALREGQGEMRHA